MQLRRRRRWTPGKNIWLQGAGRGQTFLVPESPASRRPTIFVAGSWPIAIGITGFSIGGSAEAIQVVGRVSGVIYDNDIRPFGEEGKGGIWLTGALTYLKIYKNTILACEVGLHLESIGPARDYIKPGSLVPDPNYGVWVAENGIGAARLRWHRTRTFFPGAGIVLHRANGVFISSNRISRNMWGLVVVNSNYVLVSDNKLDGNDVGVVLGLMLNVGVKLQGNRIVRNHSGGISIWQGSDLVLEGNTISYNGGSGISGVRFPFTYLKIHKLAGNLIEHNEGYGIDLDPQIIEECSGNRVSSNQKGDYSSEELRKKCEGG